MQIKIIPAIDSESVIGVRTPDLKAMAKEILKGGDYKNFLGELPHQFFEENQLHAFIISGIKDLIPVLLRILQDSFNPPSWSYSNGRNTVKVIVPVHNTFLKNIRFSWKYMLGQRKTFILAVASQLVSVSLKIVAPQEGAQTVAGLPLRL